MIETHQAKTGSTVAEGILGDWEANLDKFVKVIPTDYKRMLGFIEQVRDTGRRTEQKEGAEQEKGGFGRKVPF